MESMVGGENFMAKKVQNNFDNKEKSGLLI
jgi:hypothetical protein